MANSCDSEMYKESLFDGGWCSACGCKSQVRTRGCIAPVSECKFINYLYCQHTWFMKAHSIRTCISTCQLHLCLDRPQHLGIPSVVVHTPQHISQCCLRCFRDTDKTTVLRTFVCKQLFVCIMHVTLCQIHVIEKYLGSKYINLYTFITGLPLGLLEQLSTHSPCQKLHSTYQYLPALDGSLDKATTGITVTQQLHN